MRVDEIIAELVKRRKALGLTQEALSTRAGISRRTMVAIEAGTHDIGLRKLVRLLDATGMTLSVAEGKGRPTESELAARFKDADDE